MILSFDKEKVHLPNLPWKWERYFRNCCRITILILLSLCRGYLAALITLSVPCWSCSISCQVPLTSARKSRNAEQPWSAKFVWDGTVLGWFSICLGEHLEFQTLCTGEGAEGWGHMSWVCNLLKDERKERMEYLRCWDGTSGLSPQHPGHGKRWGGIHLSPVQNAASQTPNFSSAVFALPPCTPDLGKASQSQAQHRLLALAQTHFLFSVLW